MAKSLFANPSAHDVIGMSAHDGGVLRSLRAGDFATLTITLRGEETSDCLTLFGPPEIAEKFARLALAINEIFGVAG